MGLEAHYKAVADYIFGTCVTTKGTKAKTKRYDATQLLDFRVHSGWIATYTFIGTDTNGVSIRSTDARNQYTEMKRLIISFFLWVFFTSKTAVYVRRNLHVLNS